MRLSRSSRVVFILQDLRVPVKQKILQVRVLFISHAAGMQCVILILDERAWNDKFSAGEILIGVLVNLPVRLLIGIENYAWRVFQDVSSHNDVAKNQLLRGVKICLQACERYMVSKCRQLACREKIYQGWHTQGSMPVACRPACHTARSSGHERRSGKTLWISGQAESTGS